MFYNDLAPFYKIWFNIIIKGGAHMKFTDCFKKSKNKIERKVIKLVINTREQDSNVINLNDRQKKQKKHLFLKSLKNNT
jgi:hypothetical protein